MFLGIASVAAAVVVLIITAVSHSAGPSVLPGKFGSPEKTYEEYVRALRQDDFEAFAACFSLAKRFDLDRDGDGVNDSTSEERRKLLEKSFEEAKKGRVRQTLTVLSKPEYSAGGKTALDAGRAELRIRCFNKRINQTSDAKMSFKREGKEWKITHTDL
ncbi:MAG: hypothetical protein DRP79_02325 [Planctomycetota bacterium]|nr:MAG: hypothetical protein DRP79_02325 [Planctomycetota bacterium]